MNREYGGYLPLELPHGQEYFAGFGSDVQRLNCARSAIYAALAQCRAQKVRLPWYNCETVQEPLRRLGVPYEFYFLDEELFPQTPPLEEGEWLLYVDYFGTAPKDLPDRVKKTFGRVIFDNTQAFFAPPRMEEDSYNVYSCRKFLGVADGAYLIHKGLQARPYPADSSWQRAGHLLKCLDTSTNEAYADSLNNEDLLAREVREMSALTRRMLTAVDYAEVKRRRRENFLALHAELAAVNGRAVNADADAPMVYPLYVEKEGLHAALVQNKVYIPQWWKWLLDKVPANSVEARLSRWLLPLPVDQRYTPDDMRDLARLVRGCL